MPIFISASISPVFQNVPSFRIVEFSHSTGELTDFNQYVLPSLQSVGKWKLSFSFREEFNLADLSASSLIGLVERLHKDGGDNDDYRTYARQKLDRKVGDDLAVRHTRTALSRNSAR